MAQNANPPLQPLPASVLLEQELARKNLLCKKGNIRTGCKELDEYVLLGGLERGSVVGVSAEEEEMGMLLGLQTVANTLGRNSMARAMVVTTLPANVLLPKLRMALVRQLCAAPGDGVRNLQGRVGECLERIAIARVFDIDGLWEVLGELEDTASAADTGGPQPDQGATTAQKPGTRAEGGGVSSQDLDHDAEERLSFPEPPTADPVSTGAPAPLPDIILITHASSLLNALFTGRDKQAAHDSMLRLAAHLHHFTRATRLGGPLVMFLNSTTAPAHPDPAAAQDAARPARHPEPTLRSIFSPAPPRQAAHGYLARRSKPSFGMVFAQMLDLHLLCTRVPRTRAGAAAGDGSFAWVVEVLLDEMGMYETGAAGERGWRWRRSSREQRWAAVDVEDGRVVDA
ncbi:hypothetical protein BT67DRAFT_440059, partial [Trichocladium antarcticum]